jgi:hypothetical protein
VPLIRRGRTFRRKHPLLSTIANLRYLLGERFHPCLRIDDVVIRSYRSRHAPMVRRMDSIDLPVQGSELTSRFLSGVFGTSPSANYRSGNYLCDIAQRFFVFEKAHYQPELASINVGEPSVIQSSINLNDPNYRRFLERVDILSGPVLVIHSCSPGLAFVEDMLVTQLALSSHLPLIQKLFVILRGKPGAR